MHRPGSARRYLAAVVLAAAAAGLGACGSAPATGGPAASTAASTAPSTPAPAAPQSGPGSASGAVPSEIPIRQTTPEAVDVPPQPVRVQVEGTGIDLEVVPTGVEDNGAMTIPDNHYQAGWYRYGPRPGQPSGSAVLAAHVDSRTEALPIAGLKDVPAGTKVTVTLEDGSAVVYQTEKVENIAKRSLDGHRLFDRTGSPLLKLVTCGGRWLDTEDDYEDNVVLTAAPLS
ncbi:class F sortase [Arthrobacter sp. Sa2BUA2]|uniref:Class F sortase n=1 Tax=Arthrobacter pullicola TaxID=2762224 RepID=A0ABR8YM65_9MICC|nr:class F sortase [Arthrobacter pullicola]MBD8045325.1 class F sortase [Arthrobacter pullicola]